MKDTEYVVLDLETTGLSKRRHRITEIAAVKCRGKAVIGEFQTLVNPERHIPSFITRLTGIDDDLVKDAPTIDKVLPSFLDFLNDAIIVAHNATFDYGFIEHNARRYGRTLSNERLCTRKLANRMLPELPSKKLGAICESLEIVNDQAHRAMADTKATAKIFAHFLHVLKESGIHSRNDVVRFERWPASRCRKELQFRQ